MASMGQEFPGETASLTSGRYSQNDRFRLYVVLFVLWNILLFSLAVSGVALARKNSNNDNDSSSSSPCITTTIPIYTENKYYSVGAAVSLVSEEGGSVRLGGGTTIYKRQKISDSIENLTDFVIIDIDTEHAFLAFSDTSGSVSQNSLTIIGFLGYAIGITSSDQIVWDTAYSTTIKAGHLASGARLTQDLLIIGSDVGIIAVVPFPNTTIYIPSSRGASNNTQVCALDSNAFAISYPLEPTGMLTTAATIGGTVPTIVWSNNTIIYTPEILPAHSVACFQPEHFLLNYVENTGIVSQGVYFQATSNVISLTVAASLPDVTPAPFIQSATLKNSLALAAILYIDASQNNALIATTISLTADLVQFGSSLVINSGGVIGTVEETKIADIAPFGDDSGFVVTYSDWANQDRVTVLIGQITESNSLVAASPAYVISPTNADLLFQQYWTNIVQLSETTFVSIFALMNGTKAETIGSSTGQVYPAPLGVIMELTSMGGDQAAVVGVSGQCEVIGSQLSLGNYYYTDSLGSLFARNPSETPLYDYLDIGNTILSKNSLIGVGISDKDLLIKTEVY